MAEGIMQYLVAEAVLPWHIDSAGTSGWHNGERPDRRAIRTCQQRGIDISRQRSRLFTEQDLIDFDHILTMDEDNFRVVKGMTDGSGHRKQSETHHVIRARPWAASAGSVL